MRTDDSTTAVAERPTANGTVDHDQVFDLLARAIKTHLPAEAVDAEQVRSIVAEEIGKATLPRPIEIHRPDGTVAVLDGRQHAKFEDLVKLHAEGHANMLMVGPAGSGKTTLAKQLAEALGVDFGFISLSAGVTETHLFGRVLPQADGSWQFVPSRFVEVYENGGVFLLDEIDAADANVMVAINAALANGVMANPNGRVHKRHPSTIIIGAANTWGRGADHQYVGRNALDAATLDRFTLATVHVDYDELLEVELAHGSLGKAVAESLLEWVGELREKITRYKLRRIASTRLVIGAIKALKAGSTLDEVKARYFQDWSADERAKVE